MDFCKLVTYFLFFAIVMHYYGLPLHIIRDLYMTLRSFIQRCKDLIQYRRATANMNERYPNATAEELAATDAVCIICREEMVANGGAAAPAGDANANANRPAPAPAAAAGGNQNAPKKLPCGHIFHFNCLRSWLERQQSCPTCRRSVLADANQPAAGANAAAPAAGLAPQANPPAAAPAGVLRQIAALFNLPQGVQPRPAPAPNAAGNVGGVFGGGAAPAPVNAGGNFGGAAPALNGGPAAANAGANLGGVFGGGAAPAANGGVFGAAAANPAHNFAEAFGHSDKILRFGPVPPTVYPILGGNGPFAPVRVLESLSEEQLKGMEGQTKDAIIKRLRAIQEVQNQLFGISTQLIQILQLVSEPEVSGQTGEGSSSSSSNKGKESSTSEKDKESASADKGKGPAI
ncbi:E3 ubiquitin-protein ligase hrd1 [Blyttiomyces sp. JEL0837]|nr:E3 ubiquitin-protein ligase hrd1 [Blyttiomyces sp. JEL0837]